MRKLIFFSLLALPIVLIALFSSAPARAANNAKPKLLAQRITMGPSPDLTIQSVTRDGTLTNVIVRYCNIGQGLATTTMTVTATNNTDRTKAVSVANQPVPGPSGCNQTVIPCSSLTTNCTGYVSLRVVVDALNQIYEVTDASETNNEIAAAVLPALPGPITLVSATCAQNSSYSMAVNLAWGAGSDTSTTSLTIDDPSTAGLDKVQTGITTTSYPYRYTFVNNAFAGKTLNIKIWGVSPESQPGPVLSVPPVTCPALVPHALNIQAVPVCATGTPTSTFRIIWTKWPPGNGDYAFTAYGSGTRTGTFTFDPLSSTTTNQGIYIGLQSSASTTPLTIIGTAPRTDITYARFFVENYWMSRYMITVPTGTYTLNFQVPASECAVPQPFRKTGPVSGATLTPGNQNFSWTKHTNTAFTKYILTFKNSAGQTVLTKTVNDINTTFAGVNLWQSGDNPGAGEVVSVKPPFALGNYTWQVTAANATTTVDPADGGTAWDFTMGESAGCKPQNLQFTCGVNGDPTKVRVSWNTYGRPLQIQFDKNPTTWYEPQNGDILFPLPSSSYPSGISSVSIGTSTTSLIATLATGVDYDWAVRDSATTTQSQYVEKCRSDVTINCPATPITVTPPPNNCICKSDNTCDTSCTFDKYTTSQLSNVSYANPVGCSLASVPFSTTPNQANKNAWCQRSKRTMGDADGDTKINDIDYFYYVQAVSGGKLPSDGSNQLKNINPDSNGNGSVGTEDRIIIIKSLGGN